MTRRNTRQIRRALLRRKKRSVAIFEGLEPRQMLASDTGPQLLGISVRSTEWAPAFVAELEKASLADSGGFISASQVANAETPLSFAGVNQLRAVFSEEVTGATAASLKITDAAGTVAEATAFELSPDGKTATWTFPVVATGSRWLANIDDIITGTTGIHLDGEAAADATSASGDGRPGGAPAIGFVSQLGDFDGDATTDSDDYLPLRQAMNAKAGDTRYNPGLDLTGDGRIDAFDYALFRQAYGTSADVTSPQPYVFNTAPASADLDIDTDEDNAVAFSISTTDAEGDRVTVIIDKQAQHGSVVLNDGTYTYNPEENYFGEDTLSFYVTDGRAYSNSHTVTLKIAAINDPPYIASQPATLSITNQVPSRSVDLTQVFGDVDDETLSYVVESANSELLNASIQNGTLHVAGIRGNVAQTNVVVSARDAAGLQATETIPVDLNYPEFEPLDTIQYALASDQIIEFGGQNTFIIETNFNESERITVSSSNEGIIRPEDIEVTSLGGGKHRVVVTHNLDDYGVTYLQFHADETVFVDIAVIVMANQDNTAVASPLVSSRVSFEHELTTEGDRLRVRRAFDDRLIARQLQGNLISAETALSLVRPTPAEDVMSLHASTSGAVEYQYFDRDSNGTVSPTSAFLRGGVEINQYITVAPNPAVRSNFAAPNGQKYSDLIVDTTLEKIGQAYDPSTFGGLVNAFSTTAAIVGVVGATVAPTPFTPFVYGFAAGLLGFNLGSVAAKADAEVKIQLDPTKYAYTNEELAAHFAKIDTFNAVGNAILGTFALTPGLSAVQTLRHIEIASFAASKLSLLTLPITVKSSEADADRLFREISKRNDDISQASRQLESVERKLQETLDEAERDFATNPSSGHSEDELAVLRQTVNELEETRAQLDEKKAELKEALVADKPEEVILVVDEATVLEGAPNENTEEDRGENGDEQNAINEALSGAIGEHQVVHDIVGVGKRVYDIVKSTQAVVGQLGQLFGSASSNEGDYTDNDGNTYNIRTAQRRDTRGDQGRDMVNTSIKNDVVWTGGGNDRISSLAGDDTLYGGSGRNVYLAGEGNDEIHDGNDGSIINAGPGDDSIWPGGGSDLLDLGTGHDKVVFEGTEVGNKVLVDPSRSGELWFNEFAIDQIQLRKDRYDLEIILPSAGETQDNSIKFTGYFEHDAAGWEIVDRLGNRYSLYELTGRITAYEALQTAYADRSGTIPVYPADVSHLATYQDSSGRFTVHVAEDRRLIGDNSTITAPNLFLTFEGDTSLDGWITRNQMASLDRANELIATINANHNPNAYKTISVVGQGEGGLIAQWFSAAAATKNVSFINTQLINSPDISGLISQVAREQFPEYTDGVPKLSNYYLVNRKDWISRIGIWAGNDEIFSTWKAYDFYHDPDAVPASIDAYADVIIAHSPTPTAADFQSVSIVDLEIAHVRGVVTAGSAVDLSDLLANTQVMLSGELYNSTLSARIVLIDDDLFDPDFDVIEDTRTDREAYEQFLAADPEAIPDSGGYLLRMDFQPSSQGRDHLANGFDVVTEATRFNDDVTAGNLQLFGWEDIGLENIKPGDDRGRASSLERDSVKVKAGRFIIDTGAANGGPGTYNISITVGDREQIQESLEIAINGYKVDQLSTMPGDFLTRSYQFNTLESQLRIDFLDFGGKHDFTSINGITIEKVNYRSPLPPSEVLDDDPSLVVVTQSYLLPETSAGIEIYKEMVKAAALAAATAGVGAVLGSTSIGSSVAAAWGGNVAAGATAAAAKGSIIAGFKAALPAAVKQGVIKSLITSVPQNLISDPRARGMISGATSIFFAGRGLANPGENLGRLKATLNALEDINDGLRAAKGGLQVLNSLVGAAKGSLTEHQTAPWVYDLAASLASMTQGYRLGKLDAGFIPVDLDAVERAISNGKTGSQLLRHWQGSRDFLVLDWIPTSDNLVEIDGAAHKQLMNRSAKVMKKLVEAYLEQLQADQPGVDLDVLLIGHGAGHDINRELVTRLNTSDIADQLDYVKLVALDAFTASESRYTWYHPEMTSIVDRVDNIYQQTKLDSSLWLTALVGVMPLFGSDAGGGDLYHGGQEIGPMDGRNGGGSAGFYNRQARIFDLDTTDELLRFRHWDPNEVRLSGAELTDIEFSPDGKLVATSGKDGIATVRYVDELPDPDDPDGPALSFAGQTKFHVWGQESNVRSVSFFEVEVENGVWKQLLLTASDAKQAGNTDIDKNKILITDVETGLPLWQDRDINATRAKASPSGNVIVSGDRNGNAKIWIRNEGTITYTKHALVDAHPGAGGSYITDVVVINDEYFVTAGLQDQRVKMFRITENGASEVFNRQFDGVNQGRVRGLAYDPYNALLAVGAGKELSFWHFNQASGELIAFAPSNAPNSPVTRVDHVESIQGVAFSKPAFLLNEQGLFSTDRTFEDSQGNLHPVKRTPQGDIDVSALRADLERLNLPNPQQGVKLVTGGEDRTLFRYTLDRIDIGSIIEESVLSGAMLPIRELSMSANGSRVAVVGQDNVEVEYGGPVYDVDVTQQLDERLGWSFANIFLQGREEHNAVPKQYITDVIEQKGESFFWLRNSQNANRPGDLDKSRNLALPPNKRDNIDGIDVAPIDLTVRPGTSVQVKPLHYVLETDRDSYEMVTRLEEPVVVYESDAEGARAVGTIKNRRKDGKVLPNVFVFEAYDIEQGLDYSDGIRAYVGVFAFEMIGPEDLEGNRDTRTASVNVSIINHSPTTYRDVLELHPNRQAVDYRPQANDYDFDNDDFKLVGFPTQWQALSVGDLPVASYRKNGDSTNGIDVRVDVDTETLELLITNAQAAGSELDYLRFEIPYEVKETRYKAQSTGTVELQVALQGAPENFRYAELGADRVRLEWEPVEWSANKYIIQRYDASQQLWVKHAGSSDVSGRLTDYIYVNKQTDQPETWFRVVAKNTVSNRTHPAENGSANPAASGGVLVTWPDFVSPAWVAARAEGPARIQVSWDKVHWNVQSYLIELRKLLVAADGSLEFENEATGEYKYVSVESPKMRTVGEGRSATFKQLSPDTLYQAVVTARNGETEQFHKTFSSPVETINRDFVAGIDAERIGPRKMHISWAPVSYARAYRIVAINPNNPYGPGGRIVSDNFGQNATNGIIYGLEQTPVSTSAKAPEEWVIVVEAKDNNGNWINVAGDASTSLEISNVVSGVGQTQFDLSETGPDRYWLGPQTTAGHVVRLPDVRDLFVGTQFDLLNFSTESVVLTSFSDDQMISLSQQSAHSHTLVPAVGMPRESGIVVYKLVVQNEGGNSYWKVVTSDNTTEARVYTTPPYLAAEPYDDAQVLKVNADSKPRRLVLNWITPYWNPDTHKLEIYEVVDGQRSNEYAAPAKTYRLENLTGKERRGEFTELKPGTLYELVLTTRRSSDTFVHSERIRTKEQESPDQIIFDSETLRSFDVEWETVDWNAGGYRIRLEEADGDGWRLIREDDDSLVFGPNDGRDTVRKTVERLESGKPYRFTVEAYSNFDNTWKANDNKKIVKTRSFDLPDVKLQVSAIESTSIAVDWSSVFSTLNLNEFLFGADSATVFWKGPDGNISHKEVSSGTSYIVSDLTRGTSYEIWVRFASNDHGVDYRVLSTSEDSVETRPAQAPVVTVAPESIERHSFYVTWTHPDPQDVESFTIEISFDGSTWRKVARKRDDGNFNNRTNISPGSNGPNDPFSYKINYSRVEPTHRWKFLKAGESHFVRVIAHYDDAITPEKIGTLPEPVITAPLPPPKSLTFSDVTTTQIQLSWTQEDIEAVEHFNVFKRREGTTDWGERVAKIENATQYEFRGLNPNTSYEFLVEAVFVTEAASEKEKRDKESVSIQSEPKSTLPIVFQVTEARVDGKRKATIFWEAISPTPEKLLIEVQQYDTVGNPVGSWVQPTGGNVLLDPSRLSKQITELLPGTRYDVRVTAYDSDSQPTVSENVLSFTTEAYPPITGLDVSLPTKQGATVEWTRLETLDSDANVTENVIEVFLNDDLVANPSTGSGSGNKHSFKLTGLEPGLAYEFRIVAFNGTVKLSESARMEFFTLVDGLTVDEITQTTARANWTQFAGGGATDYRVKVMISGTDTVVRQKVVSIGSGIRRTTMDGLSAQTDYEMIVEVLKNSTVLSYSNRASFRTADAATAPTNVQLLRDTWRQLIVRWEPANWIVDDYYVELFDNSGTRVATKTMSRTADTHTFGSLDAGMTYTATVTARGSAGNLKSNVSNALATFGKLAPTNFSLAQATVNGNNVLYFDFKHFLPKGLKESGFQYRFERKGGDGQWKLIEAKDNAELTSRVGNTDHRFGVWVANKDNLQVNKTYTFRVIAAFAGGERLSSNEVVYTVLPKQ